MLSNAPGGELAPKQATVVIPVHNEAAHVVGYLKQFWDRLEAHQSAVLEILLLENGSRDGTLEQCQKVAASGIPARTISLGFASYGEAIKRGMREAKGNVIVILELDFLDADFFVSSVNHILKLGAEFVVASKRHPDSIDRRPFKRRLITWGFNTFLSRIFGLRGTDTHGLKAMARQSAVKVLDLCVTSGETFQTEFILIADRLGIPVVELPIEILEKRATPFPVFKRIPRIFTIVRDLRRSLARFDGVTPGALSHTPNSDQT